MKNYSIIFFILLLTACGSNKNGLPHIVIETEMGDIEAELYPGKAPKTVAAFLNYVDSNYYRNAAFYRVVLQEGLSPALNSGIIQGGVWQTNNALLHLPGIPHESTAVSGLSHTNGILSLARTKPGTASTEFFICVGNQTQYDYGNSGVADKEGYAAFGKVISGMETVRAIQQQYATGEQLDKKVLIKKIRRE
jgi:peptidyl-prolyl cis-trans isomerase A (cyclophilin A)